MTPKPNVVALPAISSPSFLQVLNTTRHDRALKIYLAIVLAHWAEHLAQAFQVYVLGWPVPEARGALGLWFPWLVKSEVLHYAYALIMLVAFWTLRHGFVGRSRTWWAVALAIQFWHHVEHAILFGQAIAGQNLFGRPVPTSIVQLWIPRVELHLLYNSIVFAPMVIAMYHHMFPRRDELAHMQCGCAVRPPLRAAA